MDTREVDFNVPPTVVYDAMTEGELPDPDATEEPAPPPADDGDPNA